MCKEAAETQKGAAANPAGPHAVANDGLEYTEGYWVRMPVQEDLNQAADLGSPRIREAVGARGEVQMKAKVLVGRARGGLDPVLGVDKQADPVEGSQAISDSGDVGADDDYVVYPTACVWCEASSTKYQHCHALGHSRRIGKSHGHACVRIVLSSAGPRRTGRALKQKKRETWGDR